MNQLDLWMTEEHQINKGAKYLLDIKFNNNKMYFTTNKNKAYKLFNFGF